MSESTNRFRTALHGFNREDVVAYIERITKDHAAELRSLQDVNAQLRSQVDQLKSEMEDARQNAAAQEELDEAREQLSSLSENNDALHHRVEVLEEELASLREERDRMQNAAQAAPETELSAPLPPVSQVLPQQAPAKDYSELELAAYRRAEMTERLARERASEIYQQVQSVFKSAANRFDTGKSDIEEIIKAMELNVGELKNVLNNVRSVYVQTETSFAALREKNREYLEGGNAH